MMSVQEIRAGAWEAAEAAHDNCLVASEPINPFDLVEDFGDWIEAVEVMSAGVAVVITLGAILGEEWSVGEDWEA